MKAMKRVMLILLLLSGTFYPLFAPETGEISIPLPEPIKKVFTAEDWVKAIAWVETGTGRDNPNELLAKGKFQQYPIFVDDVNRIIGYDKYSYDDRLDDTKAEEMFWVYQNHYNPEMSFEKMCRIQCGGPSGNLYSCTIPYYNLVQARLYS